MYDTLTGYRCLKNLYDNFQAIVLPRCGVARHICSSLIHCLLLPLPPAPLHMQGETTGDCHKNLIKMREELSKKLEFT